MLSPISYSGVFECRNKKTYALSRKFCRYIVYVTTPETLEIHAVLPSTKQLRKTLCLWNDV